MRSVFEKPGPQYVSKTFASTQSGPPVRRYVRTHAHTDARTHVRTFCQIYGRAGRPAASSSSAVAAGGRRSTTLGASAAASAAAVLPRCSTGARARATGISHSQYARTRAPASRRVRALHTNAHTHTRTREGGQTSSLSGPDRARIINIHTRHMGIAGH